MLVYIGTYAAKNEEGIHIYRLNMRSGALSRIGGAKGVKNPSFQAIHPNNQFLYSVSEAQDFEGRPSGSLSAFAIDAQSGALTFLNEQTSMGTGPCHVITDRAGKHILAANYGSGSVVVLPIRSDGRLGMPCAFVQHNGSSVHPRQEAPHAHCVNNDANDRFIMSADLGLDKVLIYRYDGDSGQISSNPHLPAAQVKPGSGPRHFAFHPRGKYAYVINELNSTVTAFTYDATAESWNRFRISRRCPKISLATTRRPRSLFRRTASSSMDQTAVTTVSLSFPLPPTRGSSRSFRTTRRVASSHAISASIPPGRFCWQPTSVREMSSCFASTRKVVSWKRPATKYA